MNEIALLEPRSLVPTEVFAPGGVRALLDKLEADARAVPTDISTSAGRDAIKSLCYKIARSKTALDEMGKRLTDQWRAQTDEVNAERRLIRAELDNLSADIRAPLAEWESVERARIATFEAALEAIAESPAFYATEQTAADLANRLGFLRNYPVRDWQEFAKRAAETLKVEIARTETLYEAAVQRETERAEQARQRAEIEERVRQEAARQQAEREARIAAEAAEAARRAAEERAAAAAMEAAAHATRMAAALQQAEADRIATAARAEQERAAAVEAERQRAAAEAAAEAATEAKRAADRRHRLRINAAACDAIVALGIDEADAEATIIAIAAGQIPHVSIRY